mmetsp:Transcript_18239/g.56964  ORF Transcript_18239/g.56964 Transcript_18239/m.56964 type:complete len:339 (+) Transcript_18239:325-1341(+)
MVRAASVVGLCFAAGLHRGAVDAARRGATAAAIDSRGQYFADAGRGAGPVEGPREADDRGAELPGASASARRDGGESERRLLDTFHDDDYRIDLEIFCKQSGFGEEECNSYTCCHWENEKCGYWWFTMPECRDGPEEDDDPAYDDDGDDSSGNSTTANVWIRQATTLWFENETKAIAKDGHISGWNTSLVTDMSELFCAADNDCEYYHWQADLFNEDLSAWDVSRVKTMKLMFQYAHSFNQPLNTWDVSSVTIMHGMFERAKFFNQPLDAWNVSSVRHMGQMFYQAGSFDQSLKAWNVRQLRRSDAMFYEAEFQPGLERVERRSELGYDGNVRKGRDV